MIHLGFLNAPYVVRVLACSDYMELMMRYPSYVRPPIPVQEGVCLDCLYLWDILILMYGVA